MIISKWVTLIGVRITLIVQKCFKCFVGYVLWLTSLGNILLLLLFYEEKLNFALEKIILGLRYSRKHDCLLSYSVEISISMAARATFCAIDTRKRITQNCPESRSKTVFAAKYNPRLRFGFRRFRVWGTLRNIWHPPALLICAHEFTPKNLITKCVLSFEIRYESVSVSVSVCTL